MSEHLIQKPSGHVYVATDALRKRKDMFPYNAEQGQEQELETIGDVADGAMQAQEESEEEAATDEENGASQNESQEEIEEDLETLQQQYRDVFGRPPPPKAKLETLRAKINGEA